MFSTFINIADLKYFFNIYIFFYSTVKFLLHW